jgi:DNA processing protein
MGQRLLKRRASCRHRFAGLPGTPCQHPRPAADLGPAGFSIVSGLARGVDIAAHIAVLETGTIASRIALDPGRDVLAVPGHPFDARASGCNMLIRDGFALERSAKDILEALERPEPARQPRLRPQEKPDRTKPATHGLRQQILDRLGPSPVLKDQVIRDLNLSVDGLLPEIAILEIQGALQRDAGGMLRGLKWPQRRRIQASLTPPDEMRR